MSAEDFEGVAAMAGIKRAELEEPRMNSCLKTLLDRGFVVKPLPDDHSFIVEKNGKKAQFWPYSGWFNTIGFKKRFPTARGFSNLLKEFAV